MWQLEEAIEAYREQGAPEDQQMLIALLREVQQETGPLTQDVLDAIARAYQLGASVLPALVRVVPSLKMAAHPHRLEVCANCGKKLSSWIEKTYGVRPGGACDRGGFTYHVVGCLKNCKAGPSARWDGELISRADEDKIRRIIQAE